MFYHCTFLPPASTCRTRQRIAVYCNRPSPNKLHTNVQEELVLVYKSGKAHGLKVCHIVLAFVLLCKSCLLVAVARIPRITAFSPSQTSLYIHQDDAQEEGCPGGSVITWLTEVFSPLIRGEKIDSSDRGKRWIYIHSSSCHPAVTAVTVSLKSTSAVWAVATKTYSADEVHTEMSKVMKANDNMDCRHWADVFRNIQDGLPTLTQHSDPVCFPLS